MAFTAVAALAAGAEVTTALVLSAVTEVGLAMTVVGAVTGSKDLMKIGGVMSLVGGVGGMMAGAAGTAAEAGAVAGADGSALSGASMADVVAQEGASSGMTGLEGAATAPVAQTAAVEGQALAPAAEQSGIVGQAAPTQPVAATTTPVSATPAVTQPAVTDVSGVQGPAGATAPVGAQAPVDISTPYSNPTDMRLAAGTQAAPMSSDSLFSKFSDWANQNKTLVNTGSQLIGGALKGMSDQSMWDQQMQLKNAQFARANSVGTFAPSTVPKTGIIGRAAA